LSLPTFFAAAKKVGAAPHRGNANRPQANQGKANATQNTAPKSPRQPQSHYMNPTLTYWSFLKNRPTIHTNTQKAPPGQAKPHPPQSANCDSKKNRRQRPTMPKTQRQHRHARSTASNPGTLSGPAL
ncbi:hypothetical protein, partial [Paraburkholderia dipogonis]|uniref:hypothetical protein n=1 Tax=Paraburkholderia dipogonis TaxID=1211383 RepID=UPI00361976DE